MMKYFFFALFSFSAWANEVKICEQMVKEIMIPNFSFDESANDRGYIFIKDEAQALKSLKQYDVSKLAIKDNIIKVKNEMSDCKYINDPKFKQSYCENVFPNYSYLQGLIFGMKNYGWKPSTIALGKRKVLEFAQASTTQGAPLIYLATSYSLIEYLFTEFPDKSVDLKKLKEKRYELESTFPKAQQIKQKDKSCLDYQSTLKKEMATAEKYAKDLVPFIPK